MARKVLLLINPASRKGGDPAMDARAVLAATGVEILNHEQVMPEYFDDQVRRYASEVDAVVVGGGDGSMAAVLPALKELQVPLGVLPLGTSNNLARSLQIPLTLPEACQVIANGVEKRIDLGWVNGRYFLNVAGLGISGHINREVPSEAKQRWGMLAYVATAYKVFTRYQPFWAEVHSPAGSLCLKSLQISVCNGRHFGSGLTVSADAAIDDGKLDLCSFEVKNLREVPGVARALKRGEFQPKHPVLQLNSTEFTIRTARPMLVDADGEIATRTPAHFKILPKAMTVLAPAPPTIQ